MFKVFTLLPFLLVFFLGCSTDEPPAPDLNSYEIAQLLTPAGTGFHVYLAKSPQQRKLGLSRVKSEDFDQGKGMLFIYESTDERQFWMPETYFDLDVFFLDDSFRIVDVQRQLEHFPLKAANGDVPRSKMVPAHYVLEVKTASSLAKMLKPGMQLTVKGGL